MNGITISIIVSLIIIIFIALSMIRLSKLKRRRTLGRSISKINWYDRLLLKKFAKEYPIDE